MSWLCGMKRLHLRRGEASVRGSGSSPAEGFDRSIGANLPNRMLPNLIPEGQREQKGADNIIGVDSAVSNRHTTEMDSHESWRKCDSCGRDCVACHCWSYEWCSISERAWGLCHCARIGSCSCSTSMPTPSCAFYSPRIQGLYEGENTELETATVHWTEVDSTHMHEEVERIGEENNKYFNEVLMQHPEWGAFFRDFQDLKVGKKIGEGGQGEIFEATTEIYTNLVAKVFKKEISLKDMQQHWPPQMMDRAASKYVFNPFVKVLGGAFIQDGEYKDIFAFVMNRRWGDLRTLIDQRILELLRNNYHGPPFSNWHIICHIISRVLRELIRMHESGVIHRDIKASNVLIGGGERTSLSFPALMDFECCLGTLGTGFWRAPEILEQVQRRVPSLKVVFTKAADIYSFGMLCYEITTGLIPFEGHPQYDYSIVLRGDRPRLPDDLSDNFRELLRDCWQHDPRDRPSAQTIHDKLYKLF